MGINVSQTMNGYQYENRENLKNTARQILNRQGFSGEGAQKIIDNAIFNYDNKSYSNAQLAILKASSQISLSSTLKETLRYLKSHTKKIDKQPVLGELWNLYTNDKNNTEDIIDLEIDYNAKNIFAAA